MNLLTPVVEEKVQSGIIARIRRKEYRQASRQIAEILVELHASIPDKKRVSYGIVYTINVLGEYLYTQLARTGAPIHEVAGVLFEESDDTKPKCVVLACFRHRTDERISRVDKRRKLPETMGVTNADRQADADNAAIQGCWSRQARTPCARYGQT
jgi:hypothetical protein